jgi:hypothetical protein
MRQIAIPLCVLALACAAARADSKSTSTAANRDDCKVVEMKKGEGVPRGSMSSSVTAGGGRVSGQTTMPDGTVSTHSGSSAGSGSSSSASSSAASSSDGTTIVTNSDGSCTIFVDPDRKEKAQ